MLRANSVLADRGSVVTLPVNGQRPATGPGQPGRLTDDRQAVRAALREWLQPDATRLACCYWWPTHELPDARVELRLALSRLLGRVKVGHGMNAATRAFADEVLDEAIRAVEAMHGETWDAMHQVASGIPFGPGRRNRLAEAVVDLARSRTPLPPPWMVRAAVDHHDVPSRPYGDLVRRHGARGRRLRHG